MQHKKWGIINSVNTIESQIKSGQILGMPNKEHSYTVI